MIRPSAALATSTRPVELGLWAGLAFEEPGPDMLDSSRNGNDGVLENGASVVPAMPAFYQKPQSLEDLADFVVGRVFSVLGFPHRLFPAWKS